MLVGYLVESKPEQLETQLISYIAERECNKLNNMIMNQTLHEALAIFFKIDLKA